MKQIKLTDFKIVPLEETARHEDISDEEYFAQYKGYVTASKMHKISPRRNGSMDNYYNPKQCDYSDALLQGTVIHGLILEPDDFTLHDKCGRPGNKLGAAIDNIVKYRAKGLSIAEAIQKGCDDVNYYSSQLGTRMKKLMTADNLKYYFLKKTIPDNEFVVSDKMHDVVTACISSVSKNRIIQQQLHPTDSFGDALPSFCEDTFYKDYLVTYQDKLCTTLHVKGKIDNYTVDPEKKILVLNDVKTSSDPLTNEWMDKGKHFDQLCYQMQMALYMDALKSIARKDYGFDDTWRTRCHIWASNTRPDYFSRCFVVNDEYMEDGKQVYEQCMKMIAYYEIFGHEEEVEFID